MRLLPTYTLTEVKDGVAKVEGKWTESDDPRASSNQIALSTTLVDVATGMVVSSTTSLSKTRTDRNGNTLAMPGSTDSSITITKGAYEAPKEAPKKK
ncbi:MAG: hypothetical protein FWE88_02845 [Phycisphaerae bacterium]|nr:hypothetical protein [Phycisphaerae bacterium]